MPHFTVERNWIECIGHLWMPDAPAAKRIDLTAYDLRNIEDIARECFDSDAITRDAVAHWLSLNEGDFQGVGDFVKLGDITFGCITERDAYALADDIETAVQKHTNEIVTVSTERA